MSSKQKSGLSIDCLETYLDEMECTSILCDRGSSSESLDVQEKIRSFHSRFDSPVFAQFLKGEEAFYRGDFKVALECYLASRDLPLFHFFCYRASAYVSMELSRFKKAIHFAKKALDVCPKDYMTLTLLRRLYLEEEDTEAAEGISEKIESIVSKYLTSEGSDTTEFNQEEPSLLSDSEIQRSVGIGEQEMKELTNLFIEDNKTEDDFPMFDDTQTATSTTDSAMDSSSNDTSSPDTMQSLASSTSDALSEAVSNTNAAYFGLPTQTASYRLTEENHSSEVSETESNSNSGVAKLTELASSEFSVETDQTNHFLQNELGLSSHGGASLEQRINGFQRGQVETLSRYIQSASSRLNVEDNFLLVLNGWDYRDSNSANHFSLTHDLLPSHYRKTTGGFFVRWNGKGYAINPGPTFLSNFHRLGYHIKDIDTVLVTREGWEASGDVKAIYDLNYRVNKMDPNLHIIHYYLNPQAHRSLSTVLKPHFKQERNTVHCLELYVDSPDTESLPLGEDVVLHYFPTGAVETESHGSGQGGGKTFTSIGIRLELTTSKESQITSGSSSSISLGYVSGSGYSPLLAHHLTGTDILVLGFESTGSDDYNKLRYNSDSLGYYGTQTLSQEISPGMVISCEFSGREGDIRVEATRKLREECCFSSQKGSNTILPGDTGLTVDLETQRVKCSVTGNYVDPSRVRVVKNRDSFGNLQYLSGSCFT